jgi:Putative lactococcus lactis phage r1t holin
MLTMAFWRDAGERAAKTAAQSLVATLALGTGLLDVDWVASVSVAGLATVLSVLSSIASVGVGQPGTASLLSRGHCPPAP